MAAVWGETDLLPARTVSRNLPALSLDETVGQGQSGDARGAAMGHIKLRVPVRTLLAGLNTTGGFVVKPHKLPIVVDEADTLLAVAVKGHKSQEHGEHNVLFVHDRLNR